MSVTGVGSILIAPTSVSGSGAIAPANTTFQNPSTPNIVDFLCFLTYSVQIPSAALPATSPFPQFALSMAIDKVLRGPSCIPGPVYTMAVYNCATHLLLGMTPDQQGQTYFANARSNEGFSLLLPSAGIVDATSDVSTSAAFTAPNWAAGMTIEQLGFYRTPWGRTYLGYAQSYGSSIVGLT